MPSISARPLFLLDASRNGRSMGLLLAPPTTAGRDASDNDSDTSTRTSSPRSCPRSPPVFHQAKQEAAAAAAAEDEGQSDTTTTSEAGSTQHGPQDLFLPGTSPSEDPIDDSFSSSTVSSSSTSVDLPSHEEETSKDDPSTTASIREDPSIEQKLQQEIEQSVTEETLSNTSENPGGKGSSSSSNNNDNDKSCLRKKNTKHAVGFKELSTLYVYEDDYEYKPIDTWYSAYDLKAFRADTFLTVNWMVMNSIDPTFANGEAEQEEEFEEDQLQASCRFSPLAGIDSSNSSSSSESNNDVDPINYCYYSNKHGYDREKELRRIARQQKRQLLTMGDYEFCPRGIECRTPMGRLAKNRHRVDALNVVMLYQHMQRQQRQQRRERKRALRRKEQAQFRRRSLDDMVQELEQGSKNYHHDLASINHIEADIDAEFLANVYRSYCDESSAEALERGLSDACVAGMSSTRSLICDDSTQATSSTADTLPAAGSPTQRSRREVAAIVECPSLCDEDDEDDEFIDKLVSLSFVEHKDQEEDSDIESDDGSNNSSVKSDTSVSLADFLFGPHKEEDEEDESIFKPRLQDSSIHEVENSEVEVEFVEGDEDQPHRIYCSTDNTTSQASSNNNSNTTTRRARRSNSWSHPALSVAPTSDPSSHSHSLSHPRPSSVKGSGKPSRSSFSAQELGALFGWW